MSTTSAYLTVRGIGIDVVYKDIKNLHIGVYPPLGRVRVAAPLRLDDDRVRLAVIQRLPWIKRQQQQLRDAPRQTERDMVTGESHYVDGKRLRLRVVERPGRGHLEIDGGRLVLYVPAGTPAASRRAMLEKWYRERLRHTLTELLDDWAGRLDAVVPHWSIRRMKTKWGTCNRESRNIWFNLELAKKDRNCVEYLVVHELTHYDEPTHNDKFIALMDRRLPDWRARRDELNAAPLADEQW